MEKGVLAMSALALSVLTIDGSKTSLESYKGKVVLIVNTASKCGYTSQYAGLQEIYEKYKAKGFVVLGFPSNDFGGQEPGSNEEIKKFCDLNYKVTFPLFAKAPVSGPETQPLFAFLTANAPEKGPVKWNFEKFLLNREGKVVGRFRSAVKPTDAELTTAIEKAL